MIEEELRVDSSSGIHARSANVIVEVMGEFESKVELINENAEADTDSILELMMLAAAPGTMITVRVEGEDEQEAFSELKKLFNNNFHKEEQDG